MSQQKLSFRMKRTRIYILGSLIALLMGISTGCDNEFADVNTNPNIPNSVTPNLLLPNIIRSAANEIVGTGWSIGNIVIQHTAKIQFVNEDRYLWGNINGIWNTTYGNLRELENMYTIAGSSVPVQSNYQGVALVLKSWHIALATDSYGDLPYSEATQGKTGIAKPKYDTQEEIYTRLLSDLTEANELLSPSNEAIQGDILFNGNALRWKKMANSLRLRYLMRISKKKDVKAEMQAILNDPQKFPIFENNAEHAALRFLPTVPNQFPPYTYRSGSIDEFRLSKTMEDQLKSLSDPRITVFARPTVASVAAGNPVYAGIPNGLDDINALIYNGGAQNLSRIGTSFYIDGFGIPTDRDLNIAQGMFMSYPELQFILAEAAQKGLITGDAKTYYEKGVKASFDYYGLTLPASYLTSPGVSFDPATALAQIGTQKWIALFFNGLEAWFDWRRTGIPTLKPGIFNLNENRIPVRFIYPINEYSLNKASVEAAVQRQGADNINTKVWWEK
jgi:hypothetical protein